MVATSFPGSSLYSEPGNEVVVVGNLCKPYNRALNRNVGFLSQFAT